MDLEMSYPMLLDAEVQGKTRSALFHFPQEGPEIAAEFFATRPIPQYIVDRLSCNFRLLVRCLP
jgi:hypothetical protein